LTAPALYDKLICITNQNEDPTSNLAYVERLRRRTRVARDGSWFALIVFGLVVLVAMLFYHAGDLSRNSPGCHGTTNSFTCTSVLIGRGPFGAGLGSIFPNMANVSPWATTYWVVSIFVGICAIVAFYWLHARSSGVAGRIWPFACLATAILALAVASRGWVTIDIPGDFWSRGMQALFVIALGLAVLAVIERRWSFSLFVIGFVGLALLSSLYNVSNLFQHLGIGGLWNGTSQGLPNLILPGLDLVLGGVVFWAVDRRADRAARS
jgi:hypothetical protein